MQHTPDQSEQGILGSYDGPRDALYSYVTGDFSEVQIVLSGLLCDPDRITDQNKDKFRRLTEQEINSINNILRGKRPDLIALRRALLRARNKQDKRVGEA